MCHSKSTTDRFNQIPLLNYITRFKTQISFLNIVSFVKLDRNEQERGNENMKGAMVLSNDYYHTKTLVIEGHRE